MENRLVSKFFLLRFFAAVCAVSVCSCHGTSNGNSIFPSHYEQAFRKIGDNNTLVSRAIAGDIGAISQCMQKSNDKSLDGEFAEHQGYILLKILTKFGDQYFADVLSTETPDTRESVGSYLDPLLVANKLAFPKTRALYAYRWTIR
jgi:hypothetical protein